jgi:hypothetical protein
MMATKNGSFNNLIDAYLKMREDPEFPASIREQFVWIVGEYFFKKEKESNRSFELYINNMESPAFLEGATSLFDINMEDLTSYVRGPSINDSLAGKIMLSQQYLKAFYPHHMPSFNKLPEDVRFELLDLIKEQNDTIISAFEKMLVDREADKKRKILTLVALILKNVHLRTGSPFNKLQKPAEEIIRGIYTHTEEVFTANQKQITEIQDDIKIRQLLKSFFMLRQFKDIAEISTMFKDELERYRKRTSGALK